MESAGKQLSDEALRRAMKDSGLGTPATRAAVIETLVSTICGATRQTAVADVARDGSDRQAAGSKPGVGGADRTVGSATESDGAGRPISAQDFMASIVAYVEQLIGKVRAAPTPAAIAVNTGQAATPAVRILRRDVDERICAVRVRRELLPR